MHYVHREDSSTNLWQKLHHTLLYEYRHELEAYDWFVKLDPDGIFIPSNFRRLVHERFADPSVPAYIGNAIYAQRRSIYNGGHG